MKHQFEQLTEGAKKAVVSGVNRFVKANPEPQVIHLPNQDFMLRAGNNVFSSLTPRQAPLVMKLGTHDLYDHAGRPGFIISTVGIDPASGTRLANNLGTAFANHYGPDVITPQAAQQAYVDFGNANFPAAKADIWVPDDEEAEILDPRKSSPITQPGILYEMLREENATKLGLPRRNVDSWPGIQEVNIGDVDVNYRYYGDDEPTGIPAAARSVHQRDLVNYANYGDYLLVPRSPGDNVLRYYLRGGHSRGAHDGYGAGASGHPGILQAYVGGGRDLINAYQLGRQIVAHPTELIPNSVVYDDIISRDPRSGYDDIVTHLRWKSNNPRPPMLVTHIGQPFPQR